MKILFTLLVLLSVQAKAQQKKIYTINGAVTDETGAPVRGVTVTLINAHLSVVFTDRDGKFTAIMNYPGPGKMRLEHISFKTMELPVEGSTVMNITLEKKFKEIRYRYGIEEAMEPVSIKIKEDKGREDMIYNMVQIEPKFRGSFGNYINEFIASRKEFFNREGTMVIEFCVNEKDRVSDVVLRQGLGTEADDLLVRHIKSRENGWNSAIQNGFSVKIWQRLQLQFHKSNTPGIDHPAELPDTITLPADQLTASIYQLIDKIDITQKIIELLKVRNTEFSRSFQMEYSFSRYGDNYLYLKNYIANELRRQYQAAEITQLAALYDTPFGAKVSPLSGLVYKVFLDKFKMLAKE